MRAAVLAAICVVWTTGCRDVYGGIDGLGCKNGSDECGDGEACVDGECVAAGERPIRPKADDYLVSVKPARGALAADHDDTIDVQIEARYADGRPYEGKLLVRSEPFEAATAEPALVEIHDALGSARIRGCHAENLLCPPWFRVDVALDVSPVVIIGHSRGFVRLIGVPDDRPWIFGTLGGHEAQGNITHSTSGGGGGGHGGNDDFGNLHSPSLTGAPSCQGLEWRTRATRSGSSRQDRGDDMATDIDDVSVFSLDPGQTLGFHLSILGGLGPGSYSEGHGGRVSFGGLGECQLVEAIVKKQSAGGGEALLVAAIAECDGDNASERPWRAGLCVNFLH